MKTSRTKIAGVIAGRTASTKNTKKLSREIAAYLIDNRRVNDLNSILRDVQEDRAKTGIVEVSATSAHPINSAIKADITKQIKQLYPHAQQVIISEYHDLAVIGGVRLELANQQLDLSIISSLNKFRQLTA